MAREPVDEAHPPEMRALINSICKETRMNHLLHAILMLGAGILLQGCTYGPMRGPAATGLEIYNKNARQYSVTVQIFMATAKVYAGVQRMIAKDPAFRLDKDDSQRYLLEAVDRSRRLTFQASALDGEATLLLLWADTGDSGQSGRELVFKAATQICNELQVQCEVVEP